MDVDIHTTLKFAAADLNYSKDKGTPIDCTNTQSLHGGGANTLSLSGNSNMEIQEISQWDQLSNSSTGISESMKMMFNFVNIGGGAYNDITKEMVNIPYAPT